MSQIHEKRQSNLSQYSKETTTMNESKQPRQRRNTEEMDLMDELTPKESHKLINEPNMNAPSFFDQATSQDQQQAKSNLTNSFYDYETAPGLRWERQTKDSSF